MSQENMVLWALGTTAGDFPVPGYVAVGFSEGNYSKNMVYLSAAFASHGVPLSSIDTTLFKWRQAEEPEVDILLGD